MSDAQHQAPVGQRAAEVVDDVASGQDALSRGSWDEARERFERAAEAGQPEAAEGLSWAAWWLEDVDTCLAARERAYLGYRDAGDRRSAARMALWLGDDHVEFRGAYAVARGWHARATRLLAELEPSPEHGWLALFDAHAALGDGELQRALQLAQHGRSLGEAHATPDLELFGLATEGVTRVALGDVPAGLIALDEAAAAALGGEYDTLVSVAWTCCLVMGACEQLRDHARAAQWCEEFARFSDRTGARFVRGVCRAHHGVLRAWQGAWGVAEEELAAAVDTLTTYRPAWRAEALVRLGFLRRRQGRRHEATQLFDDAAAHPMATIGRAALALDAGDAPTAIGLLERALRRSPPDQPTSRIDALELLVRAQLAGGDVAAAARTRDELQAIARLVGTLALEAVARTADGLVARASDEFEVACAHLEDAAELYLRCGASMEAARARIELGHALLALGRPSAAEREARAALDHLASVGASIDRDDAMALLAAVAARPDVPPRQDGPLTPRQLEVLRLVADGLTDHDIAARLVLSPHTVHRHVANIYTRLGCSSRPAAVAEASRRGLL